MIQALVLGLSGQQGAGKTTIARGLIRKAMGTHKIFVDSMKFADPLYACQDAIADVLERKFQTIIKRPDGPLLQVLGTEWGRRKDPNFWVEIMRNRMGHVLQAVLSVPTSKALIIVDDMRFPNEADFFDGLKGRQGLGALKIRLEASEHVRMGRAEKWRPDVNHPSEIALNGYDKWDKVLYTDTAGADETIAGLWRVVEDQLYAP